MIGQILERFIAFEDENQMFSKKIQNVYFWSYIRPYIFEIIVENSQLNISVRNNPKSGGLKQKLNKIIHEIMNVLFHNPFRGLSQKDLLVISTSRRIKNDNFFECTYTEEILKSFEGRYNQFETASYDVHKRPVRYSNIKYLDYLIIKTQIVTKLKRALKKNNLLSEELSYINNLLKEMEGYFSISLNKDDIIKHIQNIVVKQKVMYKYYDKILAKTKPKCIIEICYYEFTKLVLNEVAKDKNIKVIELQHGIMGNDHAAYNFKRKQSLPCFPDYVFLFGEYWRETTRFPIDNNKLIPVGFPYFEKKVQCKNSIKKDKKVFLFLSQPTIGVELSNLAVSLNQKLNEEEYKIIYKLHPNEFTNWETNYNNLLKSNIEVIDNAEKDLYHYFSLSDYQVGVYSTALYEGIGYGLKTFILQTVGYEYMLDLINRKNAILVNNATDIICNLHSNTASDISFNNSLWQKNSVKNLKESIESILNNN